MEYGICDEANGDNDNDDVFSPAADHIQVGSSDVQSSEHVHSGLSTPPNRRTHLQPNFTFSYLSAAGQTVHENRLL